MAGSVLGGEPVTGHLFCVALALVHRTPAILTRIDEDRDLAALAKKAMRQMDAQWEASQTDWFPDLPWPPAFAGPGCTTIGRLAPHPRHLGLIPFDGSTGQTAPER